MVSIQSKEGLKTFEKRNVKPTTKTIEDCRKTPSGSGQTSEIDDPCKLATVFAEAHGCEKEWKWKQKWRVTAPKIIRTLKTKIKNTETLHCKTCVTGYSLASKRKQQRKEGFFITEGRKEGFLQRKEERKDSYSGRKKGRKESYEGRKEGFL